MKCPDCGTQISASGMSSHRRGLACEAECAAVRAREDGLTRLLGLLPISWIRQHGIRFEKRHTGYRSGFKGKRAGIVDELWVDSWVADIWHWPVLPADIRKRAIARLALEPELKREIGNECVAWVEFDDCMIELTEAPVWWTDIDPQTAGVVFVRTPKHGQIVKRLDFDISTGRIVRVHDGIELRYVVMARDAVEMFARCTRTIRRLAEES